MTTEEKAKAYDKALEKAKSMIDDLRKGEDILAVSDLESMFPELKESKDERMLRKLIDHLDWHSNNRLTHKECDELRAWLEKQKEQKPADLVEEAYIDNRNDGTHTCATTNDGFDAFMDGFNKGYELGIKEQTKK